MLYPAALLARRVCAGQAINTSNWKYAPGCRTDDRRRGQPAPRVISDANIQDERLSPDLIHAEEEPDSLAALQIALARRVFAPRAKLVLYTWQNVDHTKRWYVRAVLRAALRACDAILCANREAVRAIGARLLQAVASSPPSAWTRAYSSPLPAARRTHVQFTLGYVGRLVPEKSVDTLVEGSRAHPFARARVDRRRWAAAAALEAQARPLGDRVQFLGALPPAQTARHIQQLDALVLPSRTTPVWKEQFGRVLTEAMACQVPVIGSNSGAIPEVMGDAGLIFPEGDAAALAHCLEQLIESPDLGRELGERGHARVMQHYTQERIVEQTAEFYRHIVQAG